MLRFFYHFVFVAFCWALSHKDNDLHIEFPFLKNSLKFPLSRYEFEDIFLNVGFHINENWLKQ
jgi:hypothetical protein